jgi:hypothetical protein
VDFEPWRRKARGHIEAVAVKGTADGGRPSAEGWRVPGQRTAGSSKASRLMRAAHMRHWSSGVMASTGGASMGMVVVEVVVVMVVVVVVVEA